MKIEVYADGNLYCMTNIAWKKENIHEKSLLCTGRGEFKTRFGSAYNAAVRLKILDEVCSHMPKDRKKGPRPPLKWHPDVIHEKANLCKTRDEFAKRFPSAWNAARRLSILHFVCSHMPEHIDQSGKNNPNFRHTDKHLTKIANSCTDRGEFRTRFPKEFKSAYRRGILDQICSHMKNPKGSSAGERELLAILTKIFPTIKKLKDYSVSVEGRPWIEAFEIDCYLEELKKGIEFNGTYWHSFKCMRKSKRKAKWSDEDLLNYHEIKDAWFATKGITILHIKEEEWNKDKQACIDKCIDFFRK